MIDRRAARTREMLHHALMSLALEKDYDEVTVAEVCDRADVGRSTFYAHFTSKDDLRRHGVGHVRKSIFDQHKAAVAADGDLLDRPLAFSLTLFEHARDHLERHRALAGSDSASLVLATVRQTVSDLVRDELASGAETDSAAAIPNEVVVSYVVGAFMAVLTWWLDGGAKLPAEHLDGMFRRLATEGIMQQRSRSGSGAPRPHGFG